jgi:hypothetical protein
VIGWLTRRQSRDPVQLGLFELAPALGSPALGSALGSEYLMSPTEAAADTGALADDVLPATAAPAERLLRVLNAHGLRGVERVVLTQNRRTMVSLARSVLRVHEGFVHAPAQVHAAIATFATSRNRAKRSAARDVIVAYPVPIQRAARRPASQHTDDAPMAARLTRLHLELNHQHFGGMLAHLDVQVSRRLARRLGHYTMRSHTGGVGEIVLSQRHVRRDGWAEATQTLLHEMVHQWQDETGRPVDHGPGFRAKCRAVGIAPAATRVLTR